MFISHKHNPFIKKSEEYVCGTRENNLSGQKKILFEGENKAKLKLHSKQFHIIVISPVFSMHEITVPQNQHL